MELIQKQHRKRKTENSKLNGTIIYFDNDFGYAALFDNPQTKKVKSRSKGQVG